MLFLHSFFVFLLIIISSHFVISSAISDPNQVYEEIIEIETTIPASDSNIDNNEDDDSTTEITLTIIGHGEQNYEPSFDDQQDTKPEFPFTNNYKQHQPSILDQMEDIFSIMPAPFLGPLPFSHSTPPSAFPVPPWTASHNFLSSPFGNNAPFMNPNFKTTAHHPKPQQSLLDDLETIAAESMLLDLIDDLSDTLSFDKNENDENDNRVEKEDKNSQTNETQLIIPTSESSTNGIKELTNEKSSNETNTNELPEVSPSTIILSNESETKTYQSNNVWNAMIHPIMLGSVLLFAIFGIVAFRRYKINQKLMTTNDPEYERLSNNSVDDEESVHSNV
ncbi:hypothetical protein G9A89_002667 [Geosiphon pyriformis]|nr:hypothetical protein G9A89_002667 [Geosiphon pyriformis]